MRILISGAGIAGLTTAWWLSQQGHHIKIVEKAPHLRAEGYMMDFFGPGYDVAERMCILDAVGEKSHQMDHFNIVNAHGKIKSGFNYQKLIRLLDQRYFLLMRGDLVNVLKDQLPQEVDITYATSIASIEQKHEVVNVTYDNGKREEFDLVVGADGIHSKVRKLVFGDEKQFRKYLGYHVAALIHNEKLQLPGSNNTFHAITVPDHQAVICPLQESKYASFFVWRTKEYPPLTEEEKHGVFKGQFENMGWVIPSIINRVKRDEKFYFDTVSQIKMKQWYNNRVVLVGDAAYCLSLMAGQGASFAMAGAYILAKSLENNDNDFARAFRQYQDTMRAATNKKQKLAARFSKSFVPRNKFSIMMTHIFMKIMFLPPFLWITKKQVGVEDHGLNLKKG